MALEMQGILQTVNSYSTARKPVAGSSVFPLFTPALPSSPNSTNCALRRHIHQPNRREIPLGDFKFCRSPDASTRSFEFRLVSSAKRAPLETFDSFRHLECKQRDAA